MQSQIYQYLLSKPELLYFVRMNPTWYRRLTRDPSHISYLNEAAKEFYGKTFYQRVGRIGENIHLLNMLLSMGEMIKDSQE